MIDVEIRNFQAIDKLSFKIDGFTAVVGRTNIGKSSIVRALKCALSGSSGSEFVRHDVKTCARVVRQAKSCKCFCSVKMTFPEENLTVLWEKGEKLNRYTVNRAGVESVYDRVGRSVELVDILGERFSPVRIGSSHSLLQFSDQFEPLFLLDLPGTAVADILSDLGQVTDVNKAMALATKDRRASASKRKVREADARELDQLLEGYVRLDSDLDQVKELEARGEKVREHAQKLALVDRLLTTMRDLVPKVRSLIGATNVEPPDVVALESLAEERGSVTTFLSSLESRVDFTESLEEALNPPLPELQALNEQALRRTSLASFEERWSDRSRIVEQLQGVSDVVLPEKESFEATYGGIRKIEGWLNQLREAKDSFTKALAVKQAPLETTPSSLSELSGRLREVEQYRVKLERLEEVVGTTEDQMAEAKAVEKSILDEFETLGICPTCSQKITPEGRHG